MSALSAHSGGTHDESGGFSPTTGAMAASIASQPGASPPSATKGRMTDRTGQERHLTAAREMLGRSAAMCLDDAVHRSTAGQAKLAGRLGRPAGKPDELPEQLVGLCLGGDHGVKAPFRAFLTLLHLVQDVGFSEHVHGREYGIASLRRGRCGLS